MHSFLQLAGAKLWSAARRAWLLPSGPVGCSSTAAEPQVLNVFRVLYCCRGGKSKSRMGFLPGRAHSSKNTPGSLDVMADPNPRRSHRPACIVSTRGYRSCSPAQEKNRVSVSAGTLTCESMRGHLGDLAVDD
ncbi:unnamed protein product [Ectocarpus sp. 12 AP-2014]